MSASSSLLKSREETEIIGAQKIVEDTMSHVFLELEGSLRVKRDRQKTMARGATGKPKNTMARDT